MIYHNFGHLPSNKRLCADAVCRTDHILNHDVWSRKSPALRTRQIRRVIPNNNTYAITYCRLLFYRGTFFLDGRQSNSTFRLFLTGRHFPFRFVCAFTARRTVRQRATGFAPIQFSSFFFYFFYNRCSIRDSQWPN